jgi:hypothetical protein
MRRLNIACAVMLIIGIGCDRQSPLTETSDSQPLGAASVLVARKTGRKGKYEEVSIQGGMGVLLDGYWAFWVKDGKLFALNGLAKSIAPDLEYGPAGLGSEELRQALSPTPSPKMVVARTPHGNPLGNDVHEVLRKKGYVSQCADVNQSINVWQHRTSSAKITGRFEGQGSGIFYRKTMSLQMESDGTVLWKAERIRVSQGILYIDTGSGWQQADIDGRQCQVSIARSSRDPRTSRGVR